jgi:hypothetical protein
MSELTLSLTLVAELLKNWPGRRSTRERVIIRITEQFPDLPDGVVADLCDVPEELVRWLRGDITGQSSIPKRTPRNNDQQIAA